jgi:hypothetical protein
MCDFNAKIGALHGNCFCWCFVVDVVVTSVFSILLLKWGQLWGWA